jgi:hypothetical protein
MEDLRDEKLGQLITGFQAQCRWFYAGVSSSMAS